MELDEEMVRLLSIDELKKQQSYHKRLLKDMREKHKKAMARKDKELSELRLALEKTKQQEGQPDAASSPSKYASDLDELTRLRSENDVMEEKLKALERD